METFIEVKEVSKTFQSKSIFGKKKDNPVLRKVSLTVLKNETLALVGESGCGKTTLGRIILGLEHATEGTIEFEGQNIFSGKKIRSAVRRNMQMVFQDPFASLDPKMKIEDSLMEPLEANKIGKNKEERRKMAKQLLERVGLNEEHLKRYPHEFSGGQRQRIGIARALALEPSFVVCDEPVSALDVSVQAQILNLLKAIQKKREMSMLFISHDLGVVRYIADRVVIMYLGRICEVGKTEEVYNHPKHPYTEYLLQAVPKMRISGRMKEEHQTEVQKASEVSEEVQQEGCPFYARCKYRTEKCSREYPEQNKTGERLFYCHHPIS